MMLMLSARYGSTDPTSHTVKYRVTGEEGSALAIAAGEQKKAAKWIDPLQIREREKGPFRGEVTERVWIPGSEGGEEESPQRFEIRLKTNIKESGSRRGIIERD